MIITDPYCTDWHQLRIKNNKFENVDFFSTLIEFITVFLTFYKKIQHNNDTVTSRDTYAFLHCRVLNRMHDDGRTYVSALYSTLLCSFQCTMTDVRTYLQLIRHFPTPFRHMLIVGGGGAAAALLSVGALSGLTLLCRHHLRLRKRAWNAENALLTERRRGRSAGLWDENDYPLRPFSPSSSPQYEEVSTLEMGVLGGGSPNVRRFDTASTRCWFTMCNEKLNELSVQYLLDELVYLQSRPEVG